MALLHKATMTPGKLDLLNAWLPRQSWSGGAPAIEQLGAYRFDDPAGEVGLEAFLLQGADGSVRHVPVTYRGEPLPGAEDHLVGTTEHSVLGRRWVYDGCADPVWVTAAVTAILTGESEVEQYFEVDGRRELRESTASVRGSGAPGAEVPTLVVSPPHDGEDRTLVDAAAVELVVVRIVGAELTAEQTLTGRWSGHDPAVLAGVRRA